VLVVVGNCSKVGGLAVAAFGGLAVAASMLGEESAIVSVVE
jgi:hypothetical protein